MENLEPEKLNKLSLERLQDAKVLFEARRYDGSFYICGYAVEMGLKHKICQTLGWGEYPASRKDSEKYRSFKTHDFEVLLHLSGAEKTIKKTLFTEWSILMRWNSEMRYSSQRQTGEKAKLMIEATETLLKSL